MQLTPRRLAGALAAVAVGLALSASTSGAATSCWQRVITDWSHDGSIGGSYSTACLRAAQRHVPTDLKIYSTIDDDLQRAVRVHAARRLAVARRPTLAAAGVPATAPASLSPFALLTALLIGLAILLAAAWLVAYWLRRRASGSRSRARSAEGVSRPRG